MRVSGGKEATKARKHSVEARAEEYSSTLAFLKLLNRLLMSSQSFHTMLHSYVRFVREGVLAPLMSRGYKDNLSLSGDEHSQSNLRPM